MDDTILTETESSDSNKLYTRICPVCGEEFTTPWVRRLSCSPECSAKQKRLTRKAKARVQRKCKCCGKEFLVAEGRRKYCSVECASMYSDMLTKELHRRKYRQIRRYNQENPTVPFQCSWCGKTFQRERGSKIKYCSPECKRNAKNDFQQAGNARRRLGIALESHEPAYKHRKSLAAGTQAVCSTCGESFIRKSIRSKYCSTTCREISERLAQHNRYHSRKVNKDSLCPVCGKELPPQHLSKFCSHECFLKFANNTESVLKKQRERTCKYCGRVFLKVLANQFYCSKACRKAAIAEKDKDDYRKFIESAPREELDAFRERKRVSSYKAREKSKQLYRGIS